MGLFTAKVEEDAEVDPEPYDVCIDCSGSEGGGVGDNDQDDGGGRRVWHDPAMENGYKAMALLKDHSLTCDDFLEALAKQGATKNITGKDFSKAAIQAVAGQIYDNGWVYDGTTSETPLWKALDLPNDGSGDTVRSFFAKKGNEGVEGLSQVDGLAVWFRPSALVFVNGHVATSSLSVVLEEVLHKFFGNEFHAKVEKVSQAVWGSKDWQFKAQDNCFKW